MCPWNVLERFVFIALTGSRHCSTQTPVAMAVIFKLLCVLVFFSFAVTGQECSFEMLKVHQRATGRHVGGKMERLVIVSNTCPCSQLEVKLSCGFLKHARKIEASAVSKSGEECLLNNGQPIYPNSNFTFTYAGDTAVPIKPLSSQMACS